mgnify:CR=1 FL=1
MGNKFHDHNTAFNNTEKISELLQLCEHIQKSYSHFYLNNMPILDIIWDKNIFEYKIPQPQKRLNTKHHNHQKVMTMNV